MKPENMTGLRRQKTIPKIFPYVILIIGAFIMIFPFLWMLLTSFKTISETMRTPPVIFPSTWLFSNFRTALDQIPFSRLYFNTAVLVVFRILFAAVFSSTAAFAFAKLRFPGRTICFALVVSQLLMPSQIFIIPQYLMLAKLGMLNTLAALVFPGLVSAFGTFFLRQSYMGLPDELMEAARLDGCNQGQAFIFILVPLTKTFLAALSVFTAVFAYTDLMWPLIVNTDLNMMTLSAGLSSLRGQFNTNFPVLMAGSLLAMWPMIVLYIIFQKQFVEGITLTGTKA
ncbi:MAG: carbohydrate ABC transporter permease [Treponema sp.]|jgi:multiple sugar transport system permease protein|nr:carbohydrate ABC transporter permease [Treponema sp.]